MEAVAVDYPTKTATVTARGVGGAALARAVNALQDGRFRAAVLPEEDHLSESSR